jgi:hypothetical protein
LLQLEAADAATEAGRPSHSYLSRVRELAKFGLAGFFDLGYDCFAF